METEICVKERKILPQTAEKEMVLRLMGISFFCTMEEALVFGRYENLQHGSFGRKTNQKVCV